MMIQEHTTEQKEKFIYPLFTTTRLSRHNMDKLRSYGKYGDSINDCLDTVFTLLETRGYETPKDQRSF